MSEVEQRVVGDEFPQQPTRDQRPIAATATSSSRPAAPATSSVSNTRPTTAAAPNAFFAPLTGLAPGEVALIKTAQGPMRLSTGVMVIYADDESFTFMTPQGHPLAGWVTFSADDDEPDGMTAAQVQMQVRAGDPLFEMGMLFGGGRMEDRWWQGTLQALAARFGAEDAEVESRIEVIDRLRHWRNFGRHNAALRSMTRPLGAPVRKLRGRRSGQ